LFSGGGGRDVRGVEQEAQEGGLAGTLSASNLDRVVEFALHRARDATGGTAHSPLG
jgi:hypothetical protein